MSGNSRIVSSSQQEIHKLLEDRITKHWKYCWRKPISERDRNSFESLISKLSDPSRAVVDWGCGTGLSSVFLAEKYPDLPVIAVDKSDSRISRKGFCTETNLPENLFFLRADYENIVRLICKYNIDCISHIFYPNPWPKPGHMMRRWHGHPVFPYLMSISRSVELRTNWEIYAEEFSHALEFVNSNRVDFSVYSVEENPVSAFEKKYSESGHNIFQVKCNGLVLRDKFNQDAFYSDNL